MKTLSRWFLVVFSALTLTACVGGGSDGGGGALAPNGGGNPIVSPPSNLQPNHPSNVPPQTDPPKNLSDAIGSSPAQGLAPSRAFQLSNCV